MRLPDVPVIVGPTASGKSAVAMMVARRLKGEIISADSRQIYKHLDIGTAKPSRKDRSEISHYFVDELDPRQEFNAGTFGERGREVIDDILRRGKIPVVVGGTGLYVRSLIDGLFEGPGADPEIREALERRVKAGEVRELIAELKRVDPEAAAKADPTKPRRIIRTLEVYRLTGRPLSDQQRKGKIETRFTPLLFGLSWERSELYRRIEERCDRMLREGFLNEVENLERLGCTPSLNALNTVGYVEAFAYLNGRIGYGEMVRLMKQNSRRYAKRQLTWFRRDARIRWIRMETDNDVARATEEIVDLFQKHRVANSKQ